VFNDKSENVRGQKKISDALAPHSSRHVRTYRLPLCRLPKVLVGSAQKCESGVSRALFHPEIAPNQLFDRYQDLVYLRQFAVKTVDDLAESSEQN